MQTQPLAINAINGAAMLSKRKAAAARRAWKQAERARAAQPAEPPSVIGDAELQASMATVCVLSEAPAQKKWRAMLPVQRMEARGQITKRQMVSALRLRADWESAGFQPRVTADWSRLAQEPVDGGPPAALTPEERYARYRWCTHVDRLPKAEWDVLQEVVLHDRSVFAIAGIYTRRRAVLMADLRSGLDILGKLQDRWRELCA